MRLVDEEAVANWALGHLEVFLGGSWQQVCAASFDSNEADIVCGQLGYRAGTVGPSFGVPNDDVETDTFPAVGVTLPGCNGSEATLLECGPGREMRPFQTNSNFNPGCRDGSFPGLTVACVTFEVKGLDLSARV